MTGSATFDPARAWATARQFEAMALGAFLQPMFAGTDLSGTGFGGGAAEQSWQGMFISALGKRIEAAGGLGLAGAVYGTLLRMQGEPGGPGKDAAGGSGVGLAESGGGV